MLLTVKTSLGQYPILVERGALSRVGEQFRLDRRVLVVTDSGVPAHYAQTVAEASGKPFVVTVPQGESSKSLDTYRFLLEKAVEYGLTRSDCMVAVGGGVVGDMTGFAAATYMRGIDFYNIPTTVLSQVDSSIGGKVAVDFGGYKNLVGAFYPPKGVLIDPDTLQTLPARQIANGLAESVKMALTFDAGLFSLFESETWDMERVIVRSLELKRDVVEQDEKEAGLRKVLNFGHTLAHAIESMNELQNLYHGECVALGMLPMCAPEVRRRLEAVLKKLGLPTKTPLDPEVLLSAMRHDKKMSGEQITVVYVPEVGKFEMRTMPFAEFEKQIRQAIT